MLNNQQQCVVLKGYGSGGPSSEYICNETEDELAFHETSGGQKEVCVCVCVCVYRPVADAAVVSVCVCV